ncbi:MAG: MBL fold metallo-hydrolase [Chitinophagaceae bacterium]|nr:MAG: MBL fold metallo-hydrolase [Chitinophagaceae bacterium]
MVHVVKNKLFPSNTYIVSAEGSECILVDPGLDHEAIDHKLTELQLKPAYILATHGHFDHVGSVSFFQRKYNASFYIHEKDEKILRSVNFFIKMMKIDKRVDVPVPDATFTKQRESVQLGGLTFDICNFPGHTVGSCLFLLNDCLFSGDMLYSKGIGVNPFPGQDKVKLKASLLEILELYKGEVMVYPGHGSAEKLDRIKLENKELTLFLEPS